MGGFSRSGVLVGLVLALLVQPGALGAQQGSAGPRERAGMGYFIGGGGWLLESGERSFAFSTGGGGHAVRNGWVLGGEGHSSFGPGGAGGYGFFNLGHVLLATDWLLVFPMLGLGGGAMARESEPSVSRCVILNPAVGVDWLLPAPGKAGVLLGLRGGFMFDLYSDTFDWSMPYVRLVVGGYGVGD